MQSWKNVRKAIQIAQGFFYLFPVLIAFFVALPATPGFAQSPYHPIRYSQFPPPYSPTPKLETKAINKHQREQPNPTRYAVGFYAFRASAIPFSTGHAFLVLYKSNASSPDSLGIVEAFGFHPCFGLGILQTVPGYIDDEIIRGSLCKPRDWVIIPVSKEEFLLTKQMKWGFKAGRRFRLCWNTAPCDCVGFIRHVAKRLNLKPPGRYPLELPAHYIRRFGTYLSERASQGQAPCPLSLSVR